MCRSVARRLVRKEETETSEHMMTVQCKQKNAYENLSGCGWEFKEILRIQRSHKSLFIVTKSALSIAHLTEPRD